MLRLKNLVLKEKIIQNQSQNINLFIKVLACLKEEVIN